MKHVLCVDVPYVKTEVLMYLLIYVVSMNLLSLLI
jgi:hypothetical protein